MLGKGFAPWGAPVHAQRCWPPALAAQQGGRLVPLQASKMPIPLSASHIQNSAVASRRQAVPCLLEAKSQCWGKPDSPHNFCLGP